MNRLKSIQILLLGSVLVATSSFAAPTSVGGDIFTLVATNAGGPQLYALTADNQGSVYAGNNSQTSSGVPLQRFRPAAFMGTPLSFDDFGPVCKDADGLAFGAGFVYVADIVAGIRKVSATDASASIFTSLTATLCGSPLVFRPSDGHLFSNVGCQTNQIREFDSTASIVTTHTTTAGVQTMAFDSVSGLIYYATYPAGEVRAYDPTSRTEAFIANIDGSIDGGLAVDRISNRLFVGTANGANQGRVYTIDIATRTVAFFASGFDGCLGILREQVSGDLYFLEAHNLYRLDSPAVTNGMSPRLFIWPAVELGWLSDTSQTYQVQWRTALDTNTWTDFGSPIRGNGMTNFLFDTTRTSPRRFYRVMVVP